MVAVTGMVLTAAVATADVSSAEVPLTREVFSAPQRRGWSDQNLGRTTGNDQYAQAGVTGLRSSEHLAGFLLRYRTDNNKIRVAVSGTNWLIKGTGTTEVTGEFRHSSSGVLRVEATGQTVRILWNGTVVTTQNLARSYAGKGVAATVRQASRGVQMFNIRAGSLRGSTTPSIDPSPSPAPSPAIDPPPSPATPVTVSAGDGHWYSGAAGDDMANGQWEAWRGSPAGIAGTWDDTREAQVELYSICRGQYTDWNRPLDIAIGGIYRSAGESWSKAASGAYDQRWTDVLTLAQKCWGSRPAGNLFIRFAHEMNLSNDWKVDAGDEGNFVKTFQRIAAVRDQVFPGAKLVFCPNEDSANGSGDVRELWPGTDANGRNYADVYAVDQYNWYPFADTAAEFQKKINNVADDGAPIGIEKHRQFAESLGAPFAIGEWSNQGDPDSGGGGGEAPVYVQELNTWLRSHAGDPADPRPGQVVYDVHFNLWRQYQFWNSTIQPKTAAAYRALPWG
jgi:hypothetical protein